MMTKSCVFSILIALTSLPLPAMPQKSLGDFAREVRQEKAKAGPKAAKVYTNDDVPGPRAGEAPAVVSEAPSTPAATGTEKAQAERNAQEAVKQANAATEASPAASKNEKPEDKTESKEYWQGRFKSARAQLANAQEQQQLVEDEVNLLQIQEVRALDPNAKTEFAGKIKDKEDELSQKRAATEQARKALEDLQKEFQASGAPEEWSQESEGSGQ